MIVEAASLVTRLGRLAALGAVAVLCPAAAVTPQAEAMASLRQVIGTAACGADHQCRTVAVGRRACGGPDAYLAWSLGQTDPVQLQRAVASYNAALAAAQPADGRVSICELVTDPGAVCVPAVESAASAPGSTMSCRLRAKGSLAPAPSR